MNNLERVCAEALPPRPLLMAHMIAGFPTATGSERIARALIEGGADILEIQIPFSDPMADGPTIAVSSEEALARGMTIAGALSIIRNAARLKKPIAVMSYINPVYHFGLEKFVQTIAKAGANALIVPDCPLDTDEGRILLTACMKYDVCFIPVVSPGVPTKRLKSLLRNARGFVYCTSRQGTTGANSSFAVSLPKFLKLLGSLTRLPIAVGFGIKSRADVQRIAPFADIVIVGSAFVATAREASARDLPRAIRVQTRSLLRR